MKVRKIQLPVKVLNEVQESLEGFLDLTLQKLSLDVNKLKTG